MATIGTCSRCGGPVQTPDFWGSTVPPVPTCGHCGAQALEPFGVVIPMGPPPYRPAPGTSADVDVPQSWSGTMRAAARYAAKYGRDAG